MAAGDIRITGSTSGDIRVRKTAGDTRIVSTAAGATKPFGYRPLSLLGIGASFVFSTIVLIGLTYG